MTSFHYFTISHNKRGNKIKRSFRFAAGQAKIGGEKAKKRGREETRETLATETVKKKKKKRQFDS